MFEYGYEDIIMDPEDPRLEGAIGKECYFSDYPKMLLSGARHNSPEYLDCLTDIRKEGACTFVDKNGSGWILIIIKKEEPKPVPQIPSPVAEQPKKEEPNADGCGEGDKAPDTPKVEDSAPSSLPQYTQSLGAIEKGYSLDDEFARIKGGK